MTKKNYTEIVSILDRSGSMHSLTNDTIGGYNSFIEDQKKLDGETNVTLVLFDSEYEKPYESTPINECKELDSSVYFARGMTAMNDAIGRTINSIGSKLAKMKEEDRPEKVIFNIITDGQENDSKEYTTPQVKKMIEHQKEKYSWDFIFMGANIDVDQASKDYGIDLGSTMLYSGTVEGVQEAFKGMSYATTSVRSKSAFNLRTDSIT